MRRPEVCIDAKQVVDMYCKLITNHNFEAEEMGLFVEEVYIQDGFDLGELLAKKGFEGILRGNVFGVKADGVNAVMLGKENGTLVVEVLETMVTLS